MAKQTDTRISGVALYRTIHLLQEEKRKKTMLLKGLHGSLPRDVETSALIAAIATYDAVKALLLDMAPNAEVVALMTECEG